MKKKIRLKAVQVHSFTTSASERHEIKGGSNACSELDTVCTCMSQPGGLGCFTVRFKSDCACL